MAASVEKYLYKKARAVYLNGLSEQVNLLDVLIKMEREGYFPPRPVLNRAGSLTDLGTASSEETQHMLRDGLERFQEGKGSKDGLFDWRYGHSMDFEVAHSSSLSSSLFAGLAEAELHFSGANNLTCTFENLQTACVNKNALVDIIAYNKPPSWKPNVDNEHLRWPKPGCVSTFHKSGRKLWVIHEILYASKLTYKSGASKSAGGKLCTIVPGIPTPGVGITVSHKSTNSLELTVGSTSKFPDKIMFAFRALCFTFNSAGELVGGYKDDAGDTRPVYRGEEDGAYDDERAQIRDLFLQTPPAVYSDDEDEDEADEDWEVQRLPIEDVAV